MKSGDVITEAYVVFFYFFIPFSQKMILSITMKIAMLNALNPPMHNHSSFYTQILALVENRSAMLLVMEINISYSDASLLSTKFCVGRSTILRIS
jgi:hypothetical protein